MARAQEEYNAYVAEHFRRGAMEQLSDEVRQTIIDGLKANWEEIHREFQVYIFTIKNSIHRITI